MMTRAFSLRVWVTAAVCFVPMAVVFALVATSEARGVAALHTLAGSHSSLVSDSPDESMWIFNRGFSGDGGSALEARLNTPTGVAFAARGQVLIADQGNGVVRVVNQSRRIRSLTNPMPDEFVPVEVGVTLSGEFLAVNLHNTVNKILLDGRVTPIAGAVVPTTKNSWHRSFIAGHSNLASEANLSSPGGISPTSDGGLLISDTLHNQVLRMEADGSISRVAGTGGSSTNLASGQSERGKATAAQLNHPTDVAALPDGAFLIADRDNHRIRLVDSQGEIATVAGSGPSGILEGNFLGERTPATKARLNQPTSLTVLRDGTVVFTDTRNNRIRRFTIGGKIETIAGTGEDGFNGHHTQPLEAKLSNPTSIDSDSNDRIVFADGNHLVRIIESLAGNLRIGSSQGSGLRRSSDGRN